MNNNIEQILNDLYKIDASFRAHEKELINIIEKLLVAKPDMKLDEAFIITLRNRVMGEAREIKKNSPERAGWFIELMQLNKLAYALGGAAITLLIAIPLINNGLPGRNNEKVSLDLGSGIKIAKLDSNAFGSLSGPGDGSPGESFAEGRGSAELSAPAPMGLAKEMSVTNDAAGEMVVEAEEAMPVARPQSGGGGGLGATVDSKMIMPAPDFVNYVYEYTGEDLGEIDKEMAVFKRVKDNTLANSIGGSFAGMDLGLIDLSGFKNTAVKSLQLSENREFGYQIYFNVDENTININSDYEKWPRPDSNCRDEACYEKYRLKESDLPSDEALLKIADKFLEDYNINMDKFGEGVVEENFRRHYASEIPGDEVFIPEIIPVRYPLKLNGATLYDDSGNVSGLSVDIDIRNKKVSGVYGLAVQKYESSAYETVTDTARLVEVAEKGGTGWLYTHPDAKNTVTLKLGTPVKGLLRHWQYTDGKGGEELYAPALIFPIENLEDAPAYFRTGVAVPLIKEVFNTRTNNGDGLIPEPMPLLREGAARTEGKPAQSAPRSLGEEEEPMLLETEAIEIDE